MKYVISTNTTNLCYSRMQLVVIMKKSSKYYYNDIYVVVGDERKWSTQLISQLRGISK